MVLSIVNQNRMLVYLLFIIRTMATLQEVSRVFSAMRRNNIVVLIVLLMLTMPSQGKQIKFTSYECRSEDPTFCTFESCILKPVNRTVKEISSVIRLHKTPMTNIWVCSNIFIKIFYSSHIFKVRGEIRHRRYNNHQVIYKFAVDGCKFIGSKYRNPVANAVYSLLRMDAYTNINHSCPYNVSYSHHFNYTS